MEIFGVCYKDRLTRTPSDSYSLHMPLVDTVRIDGPALRDLRTRRGLTLPQLASRTGRHPKAIGRLECSNGKPASKVFAVQLALALGEGEDFSAFTIPGDDTESEDTAAEEIAA